MHDLPSLRQSFTQYLIRESRALREESRKEWKRHIPNVSVYAVKRIGDALAGEPPDVWRYAIGAMWFELMLTVFVEGAPRHYLAVIDVGSVRASEADAFGYVDGEFGLNPNDELMSVTVPECIQLPERVRLESIPSLIRLKAIDELDGIYWHPFRHLFEASWIAAAHHGKSGIAIRFAPETHQLPCEVIESGVQVVNDLSGQKLELVPESGRRMECPLNEVSIRIFIADELIVVDADNPLKHRFEFVQLVTRPDEFYPWPIEWMGWVPGRQGNLGGSHGVNSQHGRQRDTEDTNGLRDTRSDAGRVLREPEEDGQAAEALNSEGPPEEVASQTAPARQSGDCSAKRTRLGSPEMPSGYRVVDAPHAVLNERPEAFNCVRVRMSPLT
jgi:hypothetical protein